MYIYDDPSADENGEFSDGDPGLGVPRSVLKAAWPNMIQRELLNLVTGAGLVPDQVDYQQVLQAVLLLSASNGFETGDVKYSYRPAPSPGWLLIDGRTIGNAASGGTALAGELAHDLFVFLWETYSNTLCPVSGGRGATAEQDWDADKTITLFDDRGEFHRIWDNGRGADPEVPARALGSWQEDEFKEHSHRTRITNDNNSADQGASVNDADYTNLPDWGYDSDVAGGPETRPRNRAINCFIKL